MKLRKRLAASVMAVVLAVSSVQFPAVNVYAAALAEDDEGGNESEYMEEDAEAGDASEKVEGVAEGGARGDALAGNSSDKQTASQQTETEDSEQIGTEKPDASAEGLEESGMGNPDDEVKDSVITPEEEEAQVLESVAETEPQLEIVKTELEGVYQFGDAPLGDALESDEPSFSVESDGEAAANNADTSGIADYIYQKMLARTEEIDVSSYNIDKDLCRSITSGILNEHPELYYVNKSVSVSYYPNNNYAVGITLTYIEGLDDAAFKSETKTALATVKAGMSDLQKAIVLHDYLAVNCEYDYGNYLAGSIPSTSYSAYGVLVNRTAVCQGYALAYKYLLNQVGINCYMVTSNEMSHAWNLIKLDGEYYQVDVTWDDPTWDTIGRACHTYMFCSDVAFTDVGDGHHDWIVTSGSEVVNYKAMDTRYDNAFWSSVRVPLVLAGDNWDDCYYVGYDTSKTIGVINKTKLSEISNIGTGICDIGRWTVWDNNYSYYTSAYSGLFQYNNRLYYNDKTSICSIAFDGTGKKIEFMADTTNGYIYGSALCQGKVLYSLRQTPNLNAKETVQEADINIQIDEPDIPVESIALSSAALTLEEGETAKLTATVTPSDATDAAITWESSNTDVATVNGGVVAAVAAGSCTIKAAAGGKSAECVVTVTKKTEKPPVEDVDVESITLDKNTLELEEGETYTLTATVDPSDATNPAITWESSNTAVATVNGGAVTAVAAGNCIITATAGGKSAICSVDVTKGTSYELTYTEVRDGVKIIGITGTAEGELKIPAQIDGLDVVEIGNRAFYGCSKLTGNLVIPDSVTSIGYNAFEGCIGFSGKLIIPDNVNSVRDSAFSGCNNISEIKISKEVNSVGDNAFAHDGIIKRKIYIYNSSLNIGKGGLGEGNTIYGYYGSTAEIYAKYDSDSIFMYLDEPEFKEYYVKNVGELINALGSHRKIILADGVYDLYGDPIHNTLKYLEISKTIDLNIEAEHPGKAELLLHNKYDPVIRIEDSAEISITGCILGHESVGKEEDCGDDGSVVTAWDSQNIKLDKCDLYGCGVWGVNAINSTITVERSVIRDCVEGIAKGSDSVFVRNCILSGNAYNDEWEQGAAFDCYFSSDMSAQDSIFLNNHNNTLFKDKEEVAIENCSFYNNVWDGGIPQNSGICLNGITWQLDGNILKLGYPLELDNGTIQSKMGKILDYSASSVPWKNCTFSKVQYAEGIDKPDTSIKLYENVLLLPADETATLEVEVTPYNDVVSSVTWVSSDISVAKVENGLVTAVSSGVCTITASVGDKSDTCIVIVTAGDIASGTYKDVSNDSDIIWVIDTDGKLTVIGKGDFDNGYRYRYSVPWYEYADYIKTAEIIVEGMTDASYMFYECSNLSSIDVNNFDTSHVTNMGYMFYGCSNLTSIDVSNFDTSQVTSMDMMFYECSNLSSIDVSNFETNQVTNMDGIFSGCSNLSSIDVSNFETSQVTDMNSMFSGCSNLSSINVSNFDTSQVTYMCNMFEDCSNLSSIDVSNFNTSQVTDMQYMFDGCSNLASIDVSNFNTEQVTDMSCMFRHCNSLLSIDISHFDTSKVIDMSDMFIDCNNLLIINTPLNLSQSVQLPASGNDVWYDFDKNTYTELPKNLSYSIKLSKNEIPALSEPYITLQKIKTIYEYGDKLNIDDLAVTYYDRNGVSSQVSNYTTNVDEIDMSTVGKKKLVVTYNDGTSVLTKELELTVTEKNPEGTIIIPVESVKLNKGTLFLKKDETFKLEATVTPDNSTYQTVTWVSSDTSIAEVKDGEVTAVANGECAIIASAGGKETICKVIVRKDTGNANNENNLNINFQNASDQTPSYTGSPITPEIKVTYNEKTLTEGADYTVKYSNNIKPGPAKITVTGKGNYKSGKSVNFDIVQADINNAVLGGTDENGELVAVSGSKLNTMLYYNNLKLTAKDYTVEGEVSTSRKLDDSDNGKKITIEGKGNFTGNREVTLRVVNKNSLSKFTVSLDKNRLNALTYDGKAHYIHEIEGAVTVTGKDGNTDMVYGRDYTIVYPNDVTNAGTKKFTVTGMGLYTGNVKKSYAIKPSTETDGMIEVKYENGDAENIRLPFTSTGVTFNNKLTVTYVKDGNTLTLKEGKDYKVTYAGNKKVGSNAKFTISFLKNYKGIAKQTRTFTIEKANLEDAMVIVADKAYTGKAGIYKSVPYVIEAESNSLLKPSNYTVTYYTDEARNTQMKGKNKVTLGDTVYVKIEAKDKGNYKSDNPIIKSYKIVDAVDISKTKVAFQDAVTKSAVKKAEYTGNKITDKEIKAVLNGRLADEDEDIVVTYVNNINKGKATVIITGTGKEGCKYAGCKVASFGITAHNIK